MAKVGPETKLVRKMIKKGREAYGRDIVINNNHGGLYAATGISDLTGCLFGVYWACEVKAPESYRVRGKPSVEKALADGPTLKQRLFVSKVLEANGTAGFAASVEQFMEILHCAEHRVYEEGCGGLYCLGHGTDSDY